MKQVHKKPLYSRQFTLVALGASRSPEQVQQEVRLARLEALEDYIEEAIQAEPVEGFLAGGLESLWLFAILPGAKAAALGFAGGLGKKAADKLYDFFENRLRKRNLLPKAASPVTPEAPQRERSSHAGRKPKTKNRKSSGKS